MDSYQIPSLAAKSGPVAATDATIDDDLAHLGNLWTKLPSATRGPIVGLVNANANPKLDDDESDSEISKREKMIPITGIAHWHKLIAAGGFALLK